MKINLGDLARHISLIGAILYMMVTPPVSDIDPEKEARQARKEAKAERRAAREAAAEAEQANKKDD